MRNPEETRRKILEAAYTLFLQHGYHGASMSRLVEATGLSKGAIYHHFSSKEEIFVEVLTTRVKELLAALRQVNGSDPREVAHARFRVLAHRFFTHRQDIHLFAIHSQNLPAGLIQSVIRALRPLFEELLQVLSEPLAQIYSPREARLFAIFALGALRFSFLPHNARELPGHFETYWKIFERFLGGIL